MFQNTELFDGETVLNNLLIGSHTDLVGPTDIWGVGSMNGVRMRFDAANAAGGVHGRRIRFVVEDAQYQVPRAIQAANKLINRDRIFIMLLGMGTPMNNGVMTQQFEAGVPNIFPLTGARSMVEPLHPMKFTQRRIYYDEIRAAVRYLVEECGKKRACVVYQDTEYGEEIFGAAAVACRLQSGAARTAALAITAGRGCMTTPGGL